MDIGKHVAMGLGDPNQGPGKHREGVLEKGFYPIFLGRRDRCETDYYLYEREVGNVDNDPNTRR
jgi:hypothetical protein